MEKLFDRHASEVQRRIDEMTPHTLKWYARKAKAFRRGISLAKDSDRYPDIYNTKEWDDTLIVKYAVATESHTVIYLKVATADNDGMPMPMAQEDMYELKRYFAEIKDAGVALEVINQPADILSLSIDIFVSHSAFNSETMADEELDKRIRRTISSVVADLPFDGVPERKRHRIPCGSDRKGKGLRHNIDGVKGIRRKQFLYRKRLCKTKGGILQDRQHKHNI